MSYAVLEYPDGSQQVVWLPDGNVKYLQGKHIGLVIVALLIILIGVPYTILLFVWQWLVRLSELKIFKWIRNTRLNVFIATYHVPYNSKYRYWTGLLLLVRIVLYITSSLTVSTSPQTSLLVIIILVGGLFLIKEIIGVRVYKNSFVNIIETGVYFNVLILSAFSLVYQIEADIKMQLAVGYISMIIMFILLFGVIAYHVYLLIRKHRPPRETSEYALALIQPARADSEITYSIVELPNPHDQDPPPEANRDEAENVNEKEDPS